MRNNVRKIQIEKQQIPPFSVKGFFLHGLIRTSLQADVQDQTNTLIYATQ